MSEPSPIPKSSSWIWDLGLGLEFDNKFIIKNVFPRETIGQLGETVEQVERLQGKVRVMSSSEGDMRSCCQQQRCHRVVNIRVVIMLSTSESKL